MSADLDDFLAAATRATRPSSGSSYTTGLEARAYLARTTRILRAVLAVCDAADARYGGDVSTQEIRAAIDEARRSR